jgi:hypothetical protein
MLRLAASLLLLLLCRAPALAGQTGPESSARPISSDGVFRASALVDSVFIDHLLPKATIDGGDFTAYLMARLGVRNLPPNFGYRATVDTSLIRLGGRIADLPPQAQMAISQLVLLLPQETRLEAQVELLPAGTEAVRFHLQGASIGGVPVPEPFLAPVLSEIGRQYPALTATGRDLYVQVPAGAKMKLVEGGVTISAP